MASQKDVRNILRAIGSLESDRFLNDRQNRIPKHMPHAHYIDAEMTGCWFPQKRAGQAVAAGELIGVMKDFFGNIIWELRLDEPCIILYQAVSYSVPRNTPLVAYGHYEDCLEDYHEHVHDDSEVKNLEELHESAVSVSDISVAKVIPTGEILENN